MAWYPSNACNENASMQNWWTPVCCEGNLGSQEFPSLGCLVRIQIMLWSGGGWHFLGGSDLSGCHVFLTKAECTSKLKGWREGGSTVQKHCMAQNLLNFLFLKGAPNKHTAPSQIEGNLVFCFLQIPVSGRPRTTTAELNCQHLRDSSSVKRTYCSSRRHKFNSQHPHQVACNGLQLQLQWYLILLASGGTCTQYGHTDTQTHNFN